MEDTEPESRLILPPGTQSPSECPHGHGEMEKTLGSRYCTECGYQPGDDE